MSRPFKVFLKILILFLIAAPISLAFWNRSQTAGRLSALYKGEITGLRVWGAGMRTGDDGFCGCAMVPKPVRVFYETQNPAEISAFIALIRPRLYLSLDPQIETCGQVTIDFVRSGKPFWIHLMGEDLKSTKGTLPITSASVDDIEEWLKQRSVREKINAALSGRK